MKKLLSIMLAAVLVLTLLPFGVFAEEEAPVLSQPVAKVGDTLYETLAEAIAETVAGDTVILLADNDEAITVDKNLTLELNGNKMTGKITLVPGVALTAPKNLDIVDGQNYPSKTEDNYITKYENGTYTRVSGTGGTWGGIDWTLSDNGALTIAPTVVKATTDNSGKWQYEIGQWPENVTYNASGGASSIGGMPFSANSVKTLKIEVGVTYIGSFTAKFPNLTGEVVIPWTVTYFGQETFQNAAMEKLTFQKVPDGEIGEELCVGVGAFKNIVVTEFAYPDDRPVHIHKWSLVNAANLEHVTFPATIKSVTGSKHVEYYHNPNHVHSGSESDSVLLDGRNPALKSITYGSEEVKALIEGSNNPWIKNNFNAANIGLTCFISVDAAMEYALENCEGGTHIELPDELPEDFEVPDGFKVVEENGFTYLVKNIYTVTWMVDGIEYYSASVREGEAIDVAVANPTKPGYTFGGWDKEIPDTMPSENYVITAIWHPIVYIPTYNATASEGVKLSVSNTVAGTNVRASVEADSGFDGVRVFDSKGNLLRVDSKDGEFSFTMPAENVKVVPFEIPFEDVAEEDYHHDPVLWAYANGFVEGTAETSFSPDAACTRAQMIVLLWRLAGCPSASSENSFADVDPDSYYAAAVSWAVEQGLTLGVDDENFDPDSACSRAEIITFLGRFAKAGAAADSSFEDVDAEAYYAAYVSWAQANGIAIGTDETSFSPDASCTRAQALAFLFRYFGK